MKTTPALILALVTILLICPFASFNQTIRPPAADRQKMHHEVPNQPYVAPKFHAKKTPVTPRLKSAGFFTTQVNVDANGNNIPADAANEPSIAVDPNDPDKMVIGWRQFDTISSDFRQAGYGFTTDGGQTWTFPGVIDSAVFRSDPVLDFDAGGNFYYNSLTHDVFGYSCKVYKSMNGGAAWDSGTDAHGGDKQWMTIDRTSGPGAGNIYSSWSPFYSSCDPEFFTRSADGGADFENCVYVATYPYWGTMAVGPSGEVYVAGTWSSDGITVVKSTNAQVPGSGIVWDFATAADVDGHLVSGRPVNPVGLIGQANIDVDPANGNVYVLASVERISTSDPADVMFARSTDGWLTWDPPVRINTDPSSSNYQWFGTMSVAPNGRIDVVWLDTRDAPGTFLSALYYCYSDDHGETWSINKRLSEPFDPQLGYPQQAKMGDYFDMVSDNTGAHLAWANTLNGEEDVYYTHIIPSIVGMNEKPVQQSCSLSCYPNPFSDHTAIRYTIPGDFFVKVSICNIYGEEIRTLVEKYQTAGDYKVTFNDALLPAGFYFCRLSAGKLTETTRLIKLK